MICHAITHTNVLSCVPPSRRLSLPVCLYHRLMILIKLCWPYENAMGFFFQKKGDFDLELYLLLWSQSAMLICSRV